MNWIARQLLVSSALLLCGAAVHADERPASPVDVISSAEVGDWCAWELKGKTKAGGKTTKTSATMVWSVLKISDTFITLWIEYREANPGGEAKSGFERRIRAGKPLTVEQVFGWNLHGIRAEDQQVSDATRKVGKAKVACKKVTCTKVEPSGAKSEVTAWMSELVKCSGIAAVEETKKGTSPEGKKSQTTNRWKLLGYGSGGKADWGKRPKIKPPE
jgi:hypothetical protein